MWREGGTVRVEVTHVVTGPIHGVGGLATVGRVERRLARAAENTLEGARDRGRDVPETDDDDGLPEEILSGALGGRGRGGGGARARELSLRDMRGRAARASTRRAGAAAATEGTSATFVAPLHEIAAITARILAPKARNDCMGRSPSCEYERTWRAFVRSPSTYRIDRRDHIHSKV